MFCPIEIYVIMIRLNKFNLTQCMVINEGIYVGFPNFLFGMSHRNVYLLADFSSHHSGITTHTLIYLPAILFLFLWFICHIQHI